MIEKKQVKDEDIIDIFQYILQYFKKCEIDDETKKFAYDFLLIAQEDLDVCKLLYKNEKYSYAVQYLQQSVEKASKSYGLYYGNFSKKEILDIGHNSVDAFILLLDKMSNYVDIVKRMHPYIKTDTSDLKSLIKDKAKRLELAKADYKSFKVILTMFDNIKRSLREEMSDIFKIVEDYPLQDLLKEGLQDSFESITGYVNGKDNKEIINQFCDIDRIKENIVNGLDFAMLYTIAGYTFPHFQYTRYPDREMKPFEYTKKLGIVRATPELISHLDRIYSNMNGYFNK